MKGKTTFSNIFCCNQALKFIFEFILLPLISKYSKIIADRNHCEYASFVSTSICLTRHVSEARLSGIIYISLHMVVQHHNCLLIPKCPHHFNQHVFDTFFINVQPTLSPFFSWPTFARLVNLSTPTIMGATSTANI